MNNEDPPDGPIFNQFHLTQHINVCVIVSRKIHFMQRITFLFGLAALREVLDAPHPIILPFMMYENSFDVYVYILLSVLGTFWGRSTHLHIRPSISLCAPNFAFKQH